MALQGNIDSFSVTDVLRLLGSSHKTGRLVVDGDRGRAALWLDNGSLVAGESTRPGRAGVDADPHEVVFDLLRFAEGSFVFDADEVPSRVAVVPAGALDVEQVIADATDALGEWDAIVAVVPSMSARIQVVDTLPGGSVELDQRAWDAVCAVASGGAGRHGTMTVDNLAEVLGLGELPAMRLARDLADTGVIAVGEELGDVAGLGGATRYGQDAFVDAPFEPMSFADDPTVPDAFDPPAPAISEVPPVYQPLAAPMPTPTEAPTAAPVATPMAAPGPVESELDEIFGEFDPFAPAPETPVSEGAVDQADADDLARQMAMLSPRAAEAVAMAESGAAPEAEERARVARFLGSV